MADSMTVICFNKGQIIINNFLLVGGRGEGWTVFRIFFSPLGCAWFHSLVDNSFCKNLWDLDSVSHGVIDSFI